MKLKTSKRLIVGLASAFALTVCSSASGGVSWSIGINMPPAAPIYYEPVPTYVVPAPAYPAPYVPLRPAPLIYSPAPQYFRPGVPLQFEYNTYRSNHYHYYDYDGYEWNDDD